MGFHKFGAVKTVVNGISFSSKLESAVYRLLLLRQKAGEIKEIKMQVPIRLKEKCVTCGDGPVVYKVDFGCEKPDGEMFYVESKGFRDASYIRREKLWRKNPPAKLEVWTGSYKYPKLSEVIG